MVISRAPHSEGVPQHKAQVPMDDLKLHFWQVWGASLGSQGGFGPRMVQLLLVPLYGVAIGSTKWGPIVHQGQYIEGFGRLVLCGNWWYQVGSNCAPPGCPYLGCWTPLDTSRNRTPLQELKPPSCLSRGTFCFVSPNSP